MENVTQFWASKVVCSFCAQVFQRFRVAVRRQIVAVSDAFTQRLAIVLGCAEKFFANWICHFMLAWRFVRFALHLQAFRRMAFHEELCPALFGMVRSVGPKFL